MSHENWRERALVAEAKIGLLNQERAVVDQRLANARMDLVTQRQWLFGWIKSLRQKKEADHA